MDGTPQKTDYTPLNITKNTDGLAVMKPSSLENPAPTSSEPQKINGQTGPKNIDWYGAFLFYCSPNADGSKKTQREVAEKFGVVENTVQKVAKRRKWEQRRDEVGKTAVELFEERKPDMIANSAAEDVSTFNDVIETAKKLLSIYKKRIDLHNRVVNGNVEGLKKDDIDRGKSIPSPYWLSSIHDTLKSAIFGRRIIFGLPTEITKGEIAQTVNDMRLSQEEIAEMDDLFKKQLDGKSKQLPPPTEPRIGDNPVANS